MTAQAGKGRERAVSIVLVVLLHVALGIALLRGFHVDLPVRASSGLKLFALAEPPPPPPAPPPPRERHRAPRREGAAAPANRTARATPLVAPTPVVRLAPPPPLVVAPVANSGAADHQGAAPVPGPGTGSGGTGTGTGSGGAGDGPGGGGGAEPPGWIGGRLRDADYPDWASRAGITGTVVMDIDVTAKGRVSNCTVRESSGNAALDALTCRLIRERLRYDPARDAAGRKVAGRTEAEQTWGRD